MKRAIIVEDEKIAAMRLIKMLDQVSDDIEVIDQFESISDTATYINKNGSPDLIFLDINLADGNGFDLFDYCEVDCPTIFVTAFDEFALKAFRKNAVDYLLKPIKMSELKEAIHRLESPEARFNNLSGAYQLQNRLTRFLIKFRGRYVLVKSDSVAYFYVQNNLSMLTTKDGRKLPLDQSLDKIEQDLDPEQFFRINRKVILCIDSIQDMFPYSRSRVKLKLDPAFSEEVIVSTERSPLFKKWLRGEEP